MSFTKKCLATAVAASTMAFGAVAPVAHAEVSGSVGIASSYLWRGSDLGSNGVPAVWGDLSYSNSGFYGGVWASSGDSTAGTEYDLYVGYGGEVGDFSYDLNLTNYLYPTGAGYAPGGETDFFEWSDAIIGLGYGPVSFTAFIPVGKENSPGDYMYFNLGASFGAYSVGLGLHSDNASVDGAVGCPADETSDSCDPVHIDFTYAYNDNLAFTFSQFIADEPAGDDLKVVVSYSIPIGE